MSEQAPRKSAEEHYSDEVSLKQLIIKLKELWFELWRNWYLILIITIPLLAFFIYKHTIHTPLYKAELTFMVNDDEGGMGGVAGVLGSFGLGGGGSGEYNLEKMLSLLKSRKIIQNVLVNRANINGKDNYFGNHLIDLLDLHSKWSEDIPQLADFYFTTDSIPAFNKNDNTALKILHSFIIGNVESGKVAMLQSHITDETGIMTLNLVSENETFSIKFLESLYLYLSEYYVDQAIEKQLNTYSIIVAKSDSLANELRGAEYDLASFVDKNRGLVNRTDQLKQLRLESKLKLIGTAYAKVIEQKEIAEFSLNDQKPVVQVIDLPIYPLEPSKSSLIKNVLIACLLGGFLGAIFIIGRKVINDVLE